MSLENGLRNEVAKEIGQLAKDATVDSCMQSLQEMANGKCWLLRRQVLRAAALALRAIQLTDEDDSKRKAEAEKARVLASLAAEDKARTEAQAYENNLIEKTLDNAKRCGGKVEFVFDRAGRLMRGNITTTSY